MSHWFYGITNAPWWVMLIYTLVMTHITMVCVTIYLHRHQAHRALELHPSIAHFCRLWLWFTTGMKTKEWVAVHRKHHAFSDRPGDPHSPVVEGLKKVLWEGTELYRSAKKNPETLEKYGKGTPGDWLERYVYSAKFLRGKQGVIALYLLDILLFGAPGIIIWGIQMAWTPFFAAGIVNGLGHFFGYRNFECADAATNMLPWGIFIAGEELHNNHHAYGTSAKLSVKWFEFDIGWMYIQLLAKCNLAQVKRLAPKAMRKSLKQDMDLETLKALVTNRLHVLAQYSKRVIAPVFRSERKASALNNSLTWRIKHLLVRNKTLIKASQQQLLITTLKKHHPLETVYHHREKLQEIWSRTTASHAELLHALQEWCQQAEQSGIESLQRFVHYLKAYQLKNAA